MSASGVQEVKAVPDIDLAAVVRKLVGSVNPVGDSHVDTTRYVNLMRLTELVETLVADLESVARYRDRPEASMKRAGQFTTSFLRLLRAEE